MTRVILFDDRRLDSWRDLVESLDQLTTTNWVFRGHDRAEWKLQTTLERKFGARGAEMEQRQLWQFVRSAPRLLPSHLVPHDNDAAAWLGLIQHYGGPTRLLDVTRSPYVALYFAFETPGEVDRALWIFDHAWCMAECGRIMAENEGRPVEEILGRTLAAQAQLVYSLVHRQPYRDQLFNSFKPFTGVFPVDPWKPDSRQSAQQAMFLCAANPAQGWDELPARQRGFNQRHQARPPSQSQAYRLWIRRCTPVIIDPAGLRTIVRISLPSSTMTNRSSSKMPGPGENRLTPVQSALTS